MEYGLDEQAVPKGGGAILFVVEEINFNGDAEARARRIWAMSSPFVAGPCKKRQFLPMTSKRS